MRTAESFSTKVLPPNEAECMSARQFRHYGRVSMIHESGDWGFLRNVHRETSTIFQPDTFWHKRTLEHGLVPQVGIDVRYADLPSGRGPQAVRVEVRGHVAAANHAAYST